MDAYQAFLAHAPWAPGWGNHEYLHNDYQVYVAAQCSLKFWTRFASP